MAHALALAFAPVAWALALGAPQDAAPRFCTLNGEAIPIADFHRFVGFEHRADPKAEAERNALYQEVVIRREAAKRNLAVTRAQSEQRYAVLDTRARAEEKKDLASILRAQDVDPDEFLRRLEATLLLEQIVRDDFDLDGSDAVPDEKVEVWLQERMARARVQTDGLSPHLLARVEDQDVTLEQFGSRLIASTAKSGATRQKLERRFLEAHAVAQYAAARGIALRDADVDREIAAREERLKSQPGMSHVALDEVLAETGTSVAQLKASLRFRTRLLLERLVADVEFPGTDLWLFWKSHAEAFDRLYGEQAIVSTICLRAGEQGAKKAGFVPRTFDAANAELDDLKSRIANGELTFEAAAKTRSEHAATARKGGLLGPVGRETEGAGALAVAAFEARERGLGKGDLVGPVKLVDGVHLLRIEGFTAKKDFAEIEPEVRKHAMGELLGAIMARAVIEMDGRAVR